MNKKFPFANEVKIMKRNLKNEIDEMSDEEFLDFASFLLDSADAFEKMGYLDDNIEEDIGEEFKEYIEEKKDKNNKYKNFRLLDKDEDNIPF